MDSNSDDARKLIKGLYQPWFGVANALGQDVQDLVPPLNFPQFEGGEGSGDEAAKPVIDVMNAHFKQMSALSESLSTQGAQIWDQMLAFQEQQFKAFSEAVDDGLRAATGMDQDTALRAISPEWSPAQVALRSLGVNDDNGLQMANETAFAISAWVEAQNASMKLSKMMSDAWTKAAHDFSVAITELEAEGPDISDMTEFHRLWVRTAEPVLQATIRSEEFCAAQADFVRKSSRHAKLRSQILDRVAKSLELPGPTEMNQAYEAIQDLRREVRTLKREVRALKRAAKPADKGARS